MNRSRMWTAILAAFALVVHLAVPFVHLSFEPEDGPSTSQTYWPWQMSERSTGPNGLDELAAASLPFAWIGLALLVIGAAVMWLGANRAKWVEPTAAGLAAIGGAMTIHGQGLWSGRGIASLANVILGTDAPSKKHLAASFSGDYYTTVWPISTWLVLGLAVVVVWRVLAALAAGAPEPRQVWRYVRSGKWLIAVWVFALIVPWSVQTLDDSTAPRQDGDDLVQDTDPFVWSLYDVSRIAKDTSQAAEDTGEAGLEEYSELAWMGNLASAAMVAALVAAGAGIIGARIASEDKLTGRSTQYLAAGTLAVLCLLYLALILLAGWAWHVPIDRLPAARTWIPLIGGVAPVLALGGAVGALRSLGADADSLLADDFPEPIVYD